MDINEHQKLILHALSFKSRAKFLELNIENLGSDLFNYHLQQLVNLGYIVKEDSGKYFLTYKAKEAISKIDGKSSQLEKQSIIIVTAICHKQLFEITKYLIHQKKTSYNFFSPRKS